MKKIDPISHILLDGGHLALDFINTIRNRFVKPPVDYITGRSAWILWLDRMDLCNKKKHYKEAEVFHLDQLIKTRELLYRIFQGWTVGAPLKDKDAVAFDRLLLKARKITRFTIVDDAPKEYLEIDPKNLNDYLHYIVKAAHQLLLSDKIHRVKECGNCGWLYLDTSKNKSRKWCNMQSCGNEVKARRHYRNKKKQ